MSKFGNRIKKMLGKMYQNVDTSTYRKKKEEEEEEDKEKE
jgi:hypothetical protein